MSSKKAKKTSPDKIDQYNDEVEKYNQSIDWQNSQNGVFFIAFIFVFAMLMVLSSLGISETVPMWSIALAAFLLFVFLRKYWPHKDSQKTKKL